MQQNPDNNAQGQQQEAQPQWGSFILRMMTFYFIYKYFTGSKQAPEEVGLPGHTNLFKPGQALELFVYLQESIDFNDYNNTNSTLIWNQPNLFYDWQESNTVEKYISFPTPESVMNNGSYYAHVFLKKSGYPHDPSDENYDTSAVIYKKHSLNKYMPQKVAKARKSLLSAEIEEEKKIEENKETPEIKIVSHWKPNLTLNLVDDFTVYPRGGIPPQIRQHLKFDETGKYFPVLFVNEFWLFREDYMEINETLKELPLTLSFSPLSLMKWQMMLQMEESFAMQRSIGTAAEDESDTFKRMLIETNPYLLGLTMVVTLLHTVFDFLAFKNDITFWKNKKSVEGISVRTMLVNFFCQTVIFLYLLDNDTSWVILISALIGLVIEAWKIQKAVIVTFQPKFPFINLTDRESYSSTTKEHDETAMRYLSYVAYPLVIGYAIYSLVYDTHKSWYSWILSSLTGCVYAFGFIMMCPQLFINYKLKSVAHLPWRTFMYKALNTFIDDLFAFIIKMPTLHRLSCFRDDIVFLIYLYQRWIYPTDYKRVNEFGQGGESDTNEQPAAIEGETKKDQ
eukprot:TRINITY_DN1907_c0_g1_i2.p1 TRINITY_DN1907_c0_g1~~TRINITY_DN1907_c0_g1_i2.p1  ORF type:complete len:565 (+),score=124.80 TRINITY_DN1907_c0_g1_i2:56-1750(+)